MLDEQFRKLLENNITCYAYEYDFYYNLEKCDSKTKELYKNSRKNNQNCC